MTCELSPQQRQNSEIEFHRGIYKIRPVELHHMPRWFMARVCILHGGWGFVAAQMGLNRIPGHSCLDHWGSGVDEFGRSVLVTEPYPSDSTIGNVTHLAELLRVHVRVIEDRWQSWWFPGWTMRIEFSECDHVPTCEGCCSVAELRQQARAVLRGKGARSCRVK